MPVLAEEHLRESEAALRALFDGLPVGVFRTTPDGRILHANRALAALMGYATVEDFRAQRLEELYADPRAREAWMARVAAGQPVRDVEVQVRRRDGTPIWVRFSAAPARDERGQLLWFDGVVEDVTAQRRAAEALRESTTLLQGVFDSLDDAVIIVSWPERRIVRVNRACERMYQRRQEELVGQSTSIFHIDDAHFAEFGRRIADKFARKEPARVEFRMRRKDGEVFPVESTTRLLLGPDGSVVAGLAVTRDLTDAKRQQAEVDAARRAAAHVEKLAAMGQLVAGVAHEIRTPLAYISNHAHLVQRVDGAAPHASAIIDGVERIDRLVASLRRFTRAPGDSRVVADLGELVAEAAGLFAATHPGARPPQLALAPQAFVRASRAELQQVALNLLENAHEATGGGGAIEVRVVATPAEVLLEVEDDGPGIEAATAERIWDPFFTTKSEGTGLGLAIVRRLVEAHGGSIRVERGARGGALFRVTLPREQV